MALLFCGWLACQLPLDAPAPRAEPLWRRTRDGWEPVQRVVIPSPLPSPGLHPVTVAAFEAMAATLALAAFSRNDRPKAKLFA